VLVTVKNSNAQCFLWIFNRHDCRNAAAWRKRRGERDLSRAETADKIVENLIRHAFVKNALVAELLQVQFEAFEFNAPLVRDVAERERPEVGLTGFRTDRCEFGTHNFDDVIPVRCWIWKDFKQFINGRCHGENFLGNGWLPMDSRNDKPLSLNFCTKVAFWQVAKPR